MANRPPRDKLPDSLIPRHGSQPPLYKFGVAVTSRFAIEYARQLHLRFQLETEEDRAEFDGKEFLDMADFDDKALEDHDTYMTVWSMSRLLVLLDLEKRCRYPGFEFGRPFSRDWNSVIVMYTNYSWPRMEHLPYKYDKIAKDLLAALDVLKDQHDHKASWWFDWQNDVVRPSFSELVCLLTARLPCAGSIFTILKSSGIPIRSDLVCLSV